LWSTNLIELDTRGLLCPLPVLKLRKAIQNIKSKETIKLITDDPAAVVDVPHFCNEQGYQITETFKENGHDLFIIKC
jgi:tRNA 2-thiouridine synthesizing protein A